jgi:ribosomal-protein-alanine N-acetyltransferase
MGYAVEKRYQGRGLMKKLCDHAIGYAFSELQLNRIMANYMPCNQRSERLLRRLGFVEEGLARNYLKINERWEDHVLTSLVNPHST